MVYSALALGEGGHDGCWTLCAVNVASRVGTSFSTLRAALPLQTGQGNWGCARLLEVREAGRELRDASLEPLEAVWSEC
eukprot:7387148-Prymnesium_polylepis.2